MYNINLERFKKRLQNVFISSRKQYLEHLISLDRQFPLQGFATLGSFRLMLEDVFIELELIPQTSCRGVESEEKSQIFSYFEVEDERKIIIFGPPGSGKTTLLKHITLTLADKKKRILSQAPDKLPLLLSLPHHLNNILEQPSYTLAQALHHDVKRNEMPTPLLPDWFEKQLQGGECFVMLDALHEIADIEKRQTVMQWIKRQINLYEANHFIITSRPYDYADSPLADLRVLNVQPFTSDQIARFVEQWLLSYERLTSALHDSRFEIRAETRAKKLLGQIEQSPALAALAANPLYLTMIATISRPNASLPTSLAALYASLYQFLLSPITHRLEFQLTALQKQGLLQHLAYQMMRRQQIELPIYEVLQVIQKPLEGFNPTLEGRGAQVLQMIEQDSGLLVQQERGKYRFAHLSFQEHLAAQYMQEKQLEEQLMKQIKSSWWHESICFYHANHDLTSLLERCLQNPSLSLLRVASRCVEEAEEGIEWQIQPERACPLGIEQRLIEHLQEEVEEGEPERRQWVAELLLALRLKRMEQVDTDLYATQNLITHAEYQLFLDEEQTKGHHYRPDHWLQDSFRAGDANKPVVGIRPLDAVNFCQWLTERDKSGWHYRLPTVGELDKEGSQPITEFNFYEMMSKQLEHSGVPRKAHSRAHQMSSRQAALMNEQAVLEHNSVIGYWTKATTPYDYELEEGPTVWHSINSLENKLCTDLERAKALSFEHDCNSARGLIDKLIPDEIYIRPIDLAGTYANAHAHVIELAQDIDLALTRTLAREGIRSRKTNLAEAKPLNFNDDLDIINALDRALALDHDIIINREVVDKKEMGKEEHEFLRWYTRFVTWLVTDVLYSALSSKVQPSFVKTFNRRRKKEQKWDKKVQGIVEQYFNLYIDLAILEERIEGNLPAFEGLRIVRERR
jgi:energy-coupling factor transporter ATP-binding protein EcfA2